MNTISTSDDLAYLQTIKYPQINITFNTIYFITGDSGCGKSSLLKLFNRSALPYSGSIYYNQQDISKLDVLAYRKSVLLVGQDVFLNDTSIKDNFDYYYQMCDYTLLSDEQIRNYLNICCIDMDINDNCSKLSGGEKQRVFLAIYLSCKPPVLLLDEPTSALDEKTTFKLFDNLKKFINDNGMTIICVSHNQELITKFGDNYIKLERNYE